MTKTILSGLLKIEEVVAVLAYLSMFLLLFAEIVSRHFFGGSLSGSEIVATLASVVAGFVGFSLVTQAGSHLRASFLDGMFPKQLQPKIMRVGQFVSFVILTGIAALALKFVLSSIEFNEKVEILYWPLWPFQAVIFYGFAASALKSLLFFLDPDCAPNAAAAH